VAAIVDGGLVSGFTDDLITQTVLIIKKSGLKEPGL
jgi:hypothetical protein